FALPASWAIKTLELKMADAQFEVADAQSAVFYAGLDLRERRERVGSMETAFVTGGDWAFSDEDVASTAASILKDHLRTMGGAARARMMLMLTPFPRPVSAERWSAETRGATVMLLSGRFPSRTAALAQLSAPLTHELFHLWVPNGLALDGQYDWFYEGFTLYQALRAGMRLDLLTFQDYLNALGRAFDAYASANGRDHLSLLEASQRRWTGTTTLVYQKGMLVAFLYDLTLRRHTRGERSLDDVYRELFRHHRLTGTRKDGNAAVIAALNGQSGMLEFVRRHIESAGQIDLAALLAPFGLRVEREGVRTRVLVADSLSREQRDLLRGFGYNAEKRTRPQRQRGE
ncbi:MAG TPA: hypothetical protein VD966_13685, partial [Pyrinomonadaceae bacterium]|nr:hypothetical protein [Pyrinomonadaceae bacterium]